MAVPSSVFTMVEFEITEIWISGTASLAPSPFVAQVGRWLTQSLPHPVGVWACVVRMETFLNCLLPSARLAPWGWVPSVRRVGPEGVVAILYASI